MATDGVMQSLETRNRALTQTVQRLYAENEHAALKIQYLQHAVELLSLPRVTDDDVRMVRDGLLVLESQMPEEMH